MPFKRSASQIANSIAKSFGDKIATKKTILEFEGTRTIRRAYNFFPKRPVDTGLSQRSSDMTLVRQSPLLFVLSFLVNTDYALAFLQPKSPSNPNFKYGPRDVRQKAAELMVKDTIPRVLSS